MGRTERRVCLHKVYFKQAKYSMETFKMLKVALGEQALGRAQVSEWNCIASGVNCAENAKSLGCPVAAKQIKVWNE